MLSLIFVKIQEIFTKNKQTAEQSEENYSPLIIAGASGAGKGTFVKLLQQAFPDKFVLSVSWTTRPMREGEENGKQYFFKSKEEFLEEVKNDGFLENCVVHEKLYGTSKKFVDETIRQKKICILEIDVKGAKKIYQYYPNSLYVQIKCPSFQVLEERLRNRKSDSEEQIQIRLKNAIKEVEELNSLSYFKTVINNTLDESFQEFKKIIFLKYQQLKDIQEKQS